MAAYQLLIFGLGNLTPVPNEDGTFRSDLNPGETLTWLGGGDNTVFNVGDATDAVWNEAQTDQTLDSAVTLDRTTYAPGTPVTPTYTIVFEDGSGNTYTMSALIFDNNNASATTQAVVWQGAIPPPGTVLTVVSETNPTGANSLDYTTFVTCFEAKTLTETEHGPTPADKISAGTRLVTATGTMEPALWRSTRKTCRTRMEMDPKLRPILIRAGALRENTPYLDLMVGPEHRVLVRSRIAQRLFGQAEVKVPARALLGMPGVSNPAPARDITYVYVLRPKHSALVSAGMRSECLYLGAMTLLNLNKSQQRGLLKTVERHGLTWNCSPYRLLKAYEARDLIKRHLRHKRPVVEELSVALPKEDLRAA